MGQISEINEDNIEDIRDYIGYDVAENIGREYFSGLISYDAFDEPAAAIVWSLKNADSFDESETEIYYFSSESTGDGGELLQEYSERIREDNIVRSSFELEDTDPEAESVLNEGGFDTKRKEGRNLYVTVEDLSSMPFTAKKKTPPYIRALESLTAVQFRQGVTNCMFCGRTGINEDLAMLPMDWYDMRVSSCMMTDGKVNGFFLIHRKPSGVLMPVLLYASGMDARKDMLNMLRYSMNAVINDYPPDTRIMVCRHDDKTRDLASYFFPGRKGEEVLQGERDEQG